MKRGTYTASEYTDMVLMYGECHGNLALALRTYRERYEGTRRIPTNPRIIYLAVQRLRENKRIVPEHEGIGGPYLNTRKEEKILEHYSQNPTTSYNSAAKQFKVCATTVNKVLKRNRENDSESGN